MPLPKDRSVPEERLRRILETHGAWLRRLIGGLCRGGPSIDPEDIEQEVAIRLWRVLKRETDIAHLPSYIRRVATTTLLDAIRRARSRGEHQRRPLVEPDAEGREKETVHMCDPAPSPEHAAWQSEALHKAKEVIETLPEARRRVVTLHLRGFTLAEVAQLTGWTEHKARNLIYRGMNSLREGMRDAGFTYEA